MKLTNKTRALVAVLVDESPTIVHRVDGVAIANQDGLLKQLRDAVLSGLEGTGGSSAFGSKPPFDPGARDLLDEIDDQAAQALAWLTKRPTPYGPTEDYVRDFAARADEHQEVELKVRVTIPREKQRLGKPSVFRERRRVDAGDLIREWADRIEDFFNPPSLREIKAPCPACGAVKIDRIRDGENVPTAALNFHRDRSTGQTVEAVCSRCRASWALAEFDFLASLIGVAALSEEQIAELALPDHTLELVKGAPRFRCTAGPWAPCHWWPDEAPSDPDVHHDECLLQVWFKEIPFESLWRHPDGRPLPENHPRAGFEIEWDDVPLWWFADEATDEGDEHGEV